MHRCPPFHLTDDGADRRGGNLPPVLIYADTEKQVDMVWHDGIISNGNTGIDGRNSIDGKINDFSVLGKPHLGRAAGSRPYGDMGQNAAPVLRADGDKIGAGAAVIITKSPRA